MLHRLLPVENVRRLKPLEVDTVTINNTLDLVAIVTITVNIKIHASKQNARENRRQIMYSYNYRRGINVFAKIKSQTLRYLN